MADSQAVKMRCKGISSCFLCGEEGEILYSNLTDRLFGAPGKWNFRKCRNSGCALIWLDPQPIEADLGIAYLNYFTHISPDQKISENRVQTTSKRLYHFVRDGYLAQCYNYPLVRFTWQKTFGILLFAFPRLRAVVQRSIMYLPGVAGGRLLDVGCGNGAFLTRMRSLGWQAEGVEVDDQAVAQGRSQGLLIHSGKLEAQKFPEDSFDAITLSHVIEHVHDPESLLSECHRLLKPGGRVVVTTPNPASWGHTLFRESWLALDPPRHLHLFDRKSLMKIASKSGFLKLSAYTNSVGAAFIYSASRDIARQGKHNLAGPVSRTAKLVAKSFSFVEYWKLKCRQEAGEELVLLGIK